MTNEIPYCIGQKIGPKNITILEIFPHKPGEARKGRFCCPICGRTDWITKINAVRKGKPKCCAKCAGAKDLKGKRFGKLVALLKDNNANYSSWICKCDCGNFKTLSVSSLSQGVMSCGCYQKEVTSQKSIKDLTGQKFGHLKVIEPTDKRYKKQVVWKCRCDCENHTIIEIPGYNLRAGITKSCGKCRRNISFGEEKILKILKDGKINFETQKSFSDCINPKTNRHLHYDFYLPDYNACIEYDGQQHFRPSSLFGGQKAFETCQYLDKIKNEYCRKAKIKLIRISYKQDKKINLHFLLSLLQDYSERC